MSSATFEVSLERLLEPIGVRMGRRVSVKRGRRACTPLKRWKNGSRRSARPRPRFRSRRDRGMRRSLENGAVGRARGTRRSRPGR